MKRHFVKTFAALAVLITCYSTGFGDIRIRFARGRTSATVSGSLVKGGHQCYVAGARNGQNINATVSSRNGHAYFADNGYTTYSNYVDYSGDHRLCIENAGGATSFTLTVSIL